MHARRRTQISELHYATGAIEREYANGTRHLTMSDNSQRFDYRNGDWRHVDAAGREVRSCIPRRT